MLGATLNEVTQKSGSGAERSLFLSAKKVRDNFLLT